MFDRNVLNKQRLGQCDVVKVQTYTQVLMLQSMENQFAFIPTHWLNCLTEIIYKKVTGLGGQSITTKFYKQYSSQEVQ